MEMPIEVLIKAEPSYNMHELNILFPEGVVRDFLYIKNVVSFTINICSVHILML